MQGLLLPLAQPLFGRCYCLRWSSWCIRLSGGEGALATRSHGANGGVVKSRRPLNRRQKSAPNGHEAGSRRKKARPTPCSLLAAGLVGGWVVVGSEVCARDSRIWVQMGCGAKAGYPFSRQKRATNGCEAGQKAAKSKAYPPPPLFLSLLLPWSWVPRCARDKGFLGNCQ